MTDAIYVMQAIQLARNGRCASQAAVDSVHRVTVQVTHLGRLQRCEIGRETLHDCANLGLRKFRSFRVSVFHYHTEPYAFLGYALLGKTLTFFPP